MFLVNHLINLELGGGSKMENYTCLLHTVNNEFEFPKKEKKQTPAYQLLFSIQIYIQQFTSIKFWNTKRGLRKKVWLRKLAQGLYTQLVGNIEQMTDVCWGVVLEKFEIRSEITS